MKSAFTRAEDTHDNSFTKAKILKTTFAVACAAAAVYTATSVFSHGSENIDASLNEDKLQLASLDNDDRYRLTTAIIASRHGARTAKSEFAFKLTEEEWDDGIAVLTEHGSDQLCQIGESISEYARATGWLDVDDYDPRE